MNTKPIVMFSGMGADSRVFGNQMEAIPEIMVPEWIAPLAGESISAYAKRFAQLIVPMNPDFVGGASFGGFVAIEMVKHLRVRGCFLIGSVRSPSELPKKMKMLRKASGVTDMMPFEAATLLSNAALLSSGLSPESNLTEMVRQLSDSDASFLRWACRAVLEWEETIDTGDTPVYQIHGEQDAVLPIRYTQPDVVIPDAGHAISMTYPEAVTGFIQKCAGLLENGGQVEESSPDMDF